MRRRVCLMVRLAVYIALATHGRSGWARLTLGSVADKVLRGATVPVLMYRPIEGGGEG